MHDIMIHMTLPIVVGVAVPPGGNAMYSIS